LAAAQTYSACNGSNTSVTPAANCVFNDITVGTNAVPGEPNYNAAGQTYPAGVGYDLASGLGSVNVANLVNSWSGATNGGGGNTPNGITVNPAAGSGSTQTFSAAYAMPNQSQEHFLITASNGANACYLIFDRGSGNLLIVNDQGTTTSGSVTPGGSGTLSNSQCSVPASSASVTISGNTVTLTVTITFKYSFTGAKNIWANTTSTSGAAGTWQQIGTWTVPVQNPSNGITVSPSSGSGSTQNFTAVYTASSQSQEHFLITASNGANACYLIYDLGSGNLSIVNDQGAAVSASVTPGGSGTLSNSQCSVPASSASVTISGNSVTLAVTITFTPSFSGPKNIWANIISNSGSAGSWQQIGTWTVPSAPANGTIVNPSSGTGLTQTFTAMYTAPNQSQEHFLITASNGAHACYLIYDRGPGNLLIVNDQGTAVSGSVVPGGSGALSNSQCSVPASTASVATSGNTVTLTVTPTFKSSFNGTKNIWANTVSTSGSQGTWTQIGTWTP
jgi:hypothetical protein